MTFEEFRESEPAKVTFTRLGVSQCLDEAADWWDLRRRVVAANADEDKYGWVVMRARKAYGVSSSGERAVLVAVLHACDFSRQADSLCKGEAWRRMESASGEWRRAMAACIAMEV